MRFIPQMTLLVLLSASLMVGCDKKPEAPAPPEGEQAKEPEGNGVELGDNLWVIETTKATVSGKKGTTEGPGTELTLNMQNQKGQSFFLQGPRLPEKTGEFYNAAMVNLTLEKGTNGCLAGASMADLADIAGGRASRPSLVGEITANDDTHVAGHFEGTLWCNSDIRDPDPIHIKGVFDIPRAARKEAAAKPSEADAAGEVDE